MGDFIPIKPAGLFGRAFTHSKQSPKTYPIINYSTKLSTTNPKHEIYSHIPKYHYINITPQNKSIPLIYCYNMNVFKPLHHIGSDNWVWIRVGKMESDSKRGWISRKEDEL
jgi:hypothetical protein